MKKNSSLWYGIGCTLVAVMVSGLVFSFLVAPVGAMLSEYKENRAIWDQIIKDNAKANAYNDRILLPQPPYITDNPANRGSYNGPCPIGTGGAPQLRQTGLSSGAECRGACGMNCPEERCKPIDEKIIGVNEGRCTYKNVTSCNSHKGCRDHDACYDYCSEKAGDNSVVFGHCHGLCNQRCYDEYGYTNCFLWAALPGSVSSTVGLIMDVTTAPLTDKFLEYSDEPMFTPDTPNVVVNANTAYHWAILETGYLDPDCQGWYSTASWCSEIDSSSSEMMKCGQIPSRCVDTSTGKNGLIHETSYKPIKSTIDYAGTTRTTLNRDGWDIRYAPAGNVDWAQLFENENLIENCMFESVDGKLHCTGNDGKTYTRESVP
jgi:hypothetical protein